MREIKPGEPFPIGGFFKRTGPTPNVSTRQFVIHIPVWCAYRTLYTSGLPLAEAREQLAEQAKESEDVRAMLEFLDRSERGLAR